VKQSAESIAILYDCSCQLVAVLGAGTPFYGVIVGRLSTLEYEVSGDVYIVDENRIRIKDFVYNGRGPGNFYKRYTYYLVTIRHCIDFL